MNDATNPRVFGKYEVIRRLAVGGMGEIFLARQVGVAGFERLVILKSLLPQLAQESDMLSQFLDEARIVGAINHPNVVACFEVGEWEGVYFIAMEYVNGVDVSAMIKACDEASQRFPIHAALTIVREAALGLDSAHHATDAQGRPLKIVHRDISPHNIMVRADGLSKVVDFGVAMATTKQKRTEGGLLKGKLGYMAPEAIKGQPVDAKSDQFSLGVVLWELLAGRRLFVGESPEAVFMKIVREVVPPPSTVMPDVAPEVDAIVLKMTAQDPTQRYGRLAECAATIRKLLDQRGALENETADLVRELHGAQLAERVRDLSPSPVRILGIAAASVDASSQSAAMCGNCGAHAVKGDRFCRSCGQPLTGPKAGTPPPSAPLEPPPQQIFAELDDDLIDVALDDASGPREAGVASASVELIDAAGTHVPSDAMLKPLWTALQEIASRYGGSITSNANRVSATFVGNGRATRCAMAFARRGAVVVARAHPQLRMRAGISGDPGLAHGDTTARDEADRLLGRARPGQLLVADRARKLANIVHAYTAGPKVLPAEGGEPQPTWELPQPPMLVGRAGERLTIEQALAAADVGRSQQLLFLGAPGSGKTTLLGAVDVEARDRGFVVAMARCARSRAPLRFDALRQVMKNACVEVLASTSGAEAGEWHKAFDLLPLGAHERRKLRALGDGELVQEDVPPARRRVLLRAALQAFFVAVAERRGLCILLDDVDRADASSLELFAELGARLSSARFVLAAAGRPMQGERVLPLARRVMLEPLEAKDAAGVVATAIGAAPPAAVVDKLAAAAGGSPAQMVALMRFAAASHLVRLEGREVVVAPELASFPLPPSGPVLSIAAHALLSPSTREVLQTCALLGQVVDPKEVSAVSPGIDVMASLAEAFAHGVLVEERGHAVFWCMSDVDALASRVDRDKARQTHARLADHLLTLRGGADGPTRIDLEERLLFHRLAAEDVARAAEHAERAADAWAQAGLFDASRDHFRRALQARWRALVSGDRAEEPAHLALDLAARATAAIGDVEPNAAVDLAMPILRLVPESVAVDARAEAVRTRAGLLLKLRRTEEALAVLDETLDRTMEKLSPGMWASLLVDLALAMEQSGNPDGARAQIHEAQKKLEEAPPAQRGRAFDALLASGRLALRARDFARSRESLTMAVEDACKRKSVASLIDALSVMSALEQAEGKVERALALLDDALSAAASVGDGVAEARLKQQAARMLQQLGRIPDALHVARQALLAAQKLGWDEGAAVAGQLVQTLESRA